MQSSITLTTAISDLSKLGIPRIGQTTSRKLALALTEFAGKRHSEEVTVEDLLNYLPTRYEDRSNFTTIRDLREGSEASLELYAKVSGGYQVGKKRAFGSPKLFIFEISATDKYRTGRPVLVWWFVSGSHAKEIIEYYGKRFARGTRFVAYGRWEWDKRRQTFALRVHKPAEELEVLPGKELADLHSISDANSNLENSSEDDLDFEADPATAAIHVGRLVPIYRKIGDFSSKQLRGIIHSVLRSISDNDISETLPPDLRDRQRLIGRAQAFREVHFPSDNAELNELEKQRSTAHLRLIFEEFFWLTFGMLLRRGERIKEVKGATLKIDDKVKKSIAAILPFKLTKAQRHAVATIFRDMESNAPMNRLLQGDVGSGKTIVAVIAMLAAMENGYQTALMAPTEILAEQHARNIKNLLAKSPYRVELLTGSLKTSEKRRLREDLSSGHINACIGTHALIQESVAFKKLGLAVIDEQHRFGVLQRAELRARGFNPDVLVLTATPIPRSLAMTVYGDLDVSVIDELPPGRKPVETRVFGEDQRQEVKRLIAQEVKAGRQVYVVYPLVEESEKMDLKDATRRYEYLRDQVFPRFSVGLVHGRMKPAEKEEIMRDFVAGKIQILVSTTVIEVGVDVPNASVMIVEHAERFGLSQLHQLRGRVGRGADKSYCILLTSDKKTNIAQERLGIMAQTNDGFIIAEKDLELRGPGEVLGTRQAGIPEFRLGNLVRDQEILANARQEAEFYLSRKSPITSRMIKQVQSDERFGLAAVG